MNRATSNWSDSTTDEEEMLTLELTRLQRQFRIMEVERKKKCQDAQNKMGKQSAAIARLEYELKEIDTELKLAQSAQNCKKDSKNSKGLKAFLSGQDQFSHMIQKEKEIILELDKQIAEMEGKINNQHRKMGGVHSSHLRHVTTQKHIQVLENRLNKATREFNNLLTENSKLREAIQHCRNQRGLFDNIHKKLMKDLTEQKRTQGELIEQSTLAYDQRDEAELKIGALIDRNQKDYAQYNMEFKELVRQLDHDSCLKKFLLQKTQEKSEMAEDEANKRRASYEEKAEKLAHNKLSEYSRAFENIRKITGKSNDQELIDRFIEMEENNFALFNYCNEVNNLMEQHADNVRSLNREICDYQLESSISIEKLETDLEELKGLKGDSEKSASKSHKQNDEQNEQLKSLQDNIKIIFDRTSCSKETISARLGDQSTVNNQNILDYLSAIEDKSNDLIERFVVLNVKENPEKSVVSSKTHKEGNDDSLPAPGFDELFDENEQILDLTTMRSRAQQYLKNKETEKEKKGGNEPTKTNAERTVKSKKKSKN